VVASYRSRLSGDRELDAHQKLILLDRLGGVRWAEASSSNQLQHEASKKFMLEQEAKAG
jgi:hypothetical protein